jgi:DNA replication licensing factor MCM3
MAENIELFKEFIFNSKDGTDMTESMVKASLDDKRRIIFSIDKIRQHSKLLSSSILNNPLTMVPYIEEEIFKMCNKSMHFGVKGSFGDHLLNPRILTSVFLGKMVGIEGIVTSCSLVRPKVSKSVHYNEAKNIFMEKDYRDSTTISKLPITSFAYPTKDSDGNYLTTEFGLSEYFDHQTIVIQEMPEKAPPRQMSATRISRRTSLLRLCVDLIFFFVFIGIYLA